MFVLSGLREGANIDVHSTRLFALRAAMLAHGANIGVKLGNLRRPGI
jgi:hypothetical protein